jgi:hypothetical protein
MKQNNMTIEYVGAAVSALYKEDMTFAAYVDSFAHYTVVKTEGDQATRQMMHDLIMNELNKAYPEIKDEHRMLVAEYVAKHRDSFLGE